MMNDESAYPIGTPGQKWGDAERSEWFEQQTVKRAYSEQVLAKIGALSEQFSVEQYGALSVSADRYPLFALKSRNWDSAKPTVLITGGVHGYETSGVQGALRFLETKVADYLEHFNIVSAPCVSPWGYESINRWNPAAIDPNRSFYANSPSEEAAFLMAYLESNNFQFVMHIDLHETTDSDNSEFRPALAARDAIVHENWHIPDGFYTVGDSLKPAPDFQAAVIRSVEQVTHIAPPDEEDQIIGAKLEQWGVINYAARELGLCMGMTDARFVTTTEVYPDSPKADDENCTVAQVAAVVGGLDYILNRLPFEVADINR
jgi:hypothetical protein